MSFLTGKPQKQKSESGNSAYPFIQDNFGSSGAGAYNSAIGAAQSALGSSPQDFFENGGGKFLLNQGLDALTSKYAAMGLTHSGAAMKGMEDYREGLASTFLQNYLGDLMGLGDLGAKGGGLVTSAGQYSKGQGTGGTQGLGSLIGAALAFI